MTVTMKVTKHDIDWARTKCIRGIEKIDTVADLAEFLARLQMKGIVKAPPLVRFGAWRAGIGKGLTQQAWEEFWVLTYSKNPELAEVVIEQAMKWLHRSPRSFKHDQLVEMLLDLEDILGQDFGTF